MSKEADFCTVCDHKIIPGVACDGQPEECPFHAVHHNNAHRQESRYATVVDSMIGDKDLDTVKGID